MMPEKIWAHLRQLGEEATPENTTWNTFGRGTEYIRADVHEAEIERLNKALEQVVEALEQATIAMRHPLDDWKGNVEADALGLANAALNEYYAAKQENR